MSFHCHYCEIGEFLKEAAPNNAQGILEILEAMWINGTPSPEELPGSAGDRKRLARILREIEQTQKFCRSLANGDLSSTLKSKGVTAGFLKALQASLLHVTWQAKMISEGDFSQRIDFMGEFAEAFNTMTVKLSNAQSILKHREQDLVETNLKLHSEVQERRSVENKLRLSNMKLQQQLDDNEKLQKRLKEELIRDSLTGLFNRRFLLERIDREFALAVRNGRPISILLMDIDFFKRVNDNFGHQMGDLVLQTLAGLMRRYSRTDDIASRIGGEEFVLMMPGVSLENGLVRAEEFRQKVEGVKIRCNGSRPKITVSIGVASVPTHGIVSQKVMLAADKALYSAKNGGRNRVRVAETPRMV